MCLRFHELEGAAFHKSHETAPRCFQQAHLATMTPLFLLLLVYFGSTSPVGDSLREAVSYVTDGLDKRD